MLYISNVSKEFHMKAKDVIRVFLGSGFFLGLGPFVPGSFGALVGLAWHAFAFQRGWQPLDLRIWCLTGAVLFSALHYILTPWAQKYFSRNRALFSRKSHFRPRALYEVQSLQPKTSFSVGYYHL
jgi:hypothetical protein